MSAQRANQLIEAGVWLQATGDYEGARRLFEQALRLDPDNPRARDLMSGRATPQSAMGSRPPSVPPSWNPFRNDPSRSEPPPAPEEGESWPGGLRNKELSPDAFSGWDTKSNPGELLDDGSAEPHDALDLVATPTPMPSFPVSPSAHRPRAAVSRDEVEKLVRRARDLLELDDHSGAMELILRAQELSPGDREVKQLRERSERTLLAMYESKLAGLDRMPKVALKEDEIIWLNLDHRAGFMLAQIDGQVSFEDLFAISGMSRLDTARILAQLVEEGVIKV